MALKLNGTNSVAAPAYAGADADTGLQCGTDEVNLVTGGTARLKIDSSGNVGIGTTSPSQQLHIASANTSSSGTIIASDSQGRGVLIESPYIGNSVGKIGISGTDSALAFGSGSSNTERMRIDSSGRLLVGTSSAVDSGATSSLQVVNTSTAIIALGRNDSSISAGNDLGAIRFYGNDGGSYQHCAQIVAEADGDHANNDKPTRLVFSTTADSGSSPTERLRIDSSGRVGIGTSSLVSKFTIDNGGRADPSSTGSTTQSNAALEINADSESNTRLMAGMSTGSKFWMQVQNTSGNTADDILLNPIGGRVGIGTTSPATRTHLDGTDNGTDNVLFLTAANLASGAGGKIAFGGNYDGTNRTSWADIKGSKDNATSGQYGGYLSLSTRPNGGSNTERMRIRSDGHILCGKSTTSFSTNGTVLGADGYIDAVRNSTVLYINRRSSDGALVAFYQDATQEGTISVSGTTISYNGGHLTRWSQLASGAERTEILRGSVLSNLDEMCEWGEEDNEQLNRMKISDVEGDRNVSGVFQDWDDDDDTYTNDFYCAMTGDFIIRIAQGTTVARGDLLMSAGDGTAKPQDDDIVRSKTIAKVTSTTVSTTYSDGSYCVPCVLMAC